MNPTNPREHTVSYDTTMCVPDTGTQEARLLMAKAYKAALTLQQQNHLTSELENNDKLVYHIGLTPQKVSKSNNLVVLFSI